MEKDDRGVYQVMKCALAARAAMCTAVKLVRLSRKTGEASTDRK
jgi:hypothetical protein